MDRVVAVALMALGVTCFASVGALYRVALADGTSFALAPATRGLVTLIVLAPAMARAGPGLWRTTVPWTHVLRSATRYSAPTRKAAVEAGLRLLVELADQRQAVAEIRGLGWEGDLDAMREDIPLPRRRDRA